MLDPRKPLSVQQLTQQLAQIPAVDVVLQQSKIQDYIAESGHTLVRDAIREVLLDLRHQLQNGQGGEQDLQLDTLVAQVATKIDSEKASSIKAVFNLSGTVIHTNLGRAPLAKEIIDRVSSVAGACNLEFDLGSGRRGDRDTHLERRLCELTGAEAATVVNNNAAALVLVLNTLAKNKSVPVSRGELVEIGGSFRIPDIISTAGCTIKEVGTTNRTHLKDYEQAIDEQTALLLKVHTSNYSIEGFTKAISEVELSKLAKAKQIPLVSDLGSGSLIDLQAYGLPKEPQVSQMLKEGVDVVTFSGDKLLGGPQAGLIVGKKDLIDQIKNNPLKRALRVDKLIIAALEATLSLYKKPELLPVKLPTLRLLTRQLSEIQSTAEQVLPALQTVFRDLAEVAIEACQSQIGSGALPMNVLDSKAITIKPNTKPGETDKRLTTIAKAFRSLPKPVIGRVNDGVLYFDCRCLEDVDGFIDQLKQLELPK